LSGLENVLSRHRDYSPHLMPNSMQSIIFPYNDNSTM
jgi:hypothetical protein